MGKADFRAYGNLCEVRIQLPWDIAHRLAEHGPALLNALVQAVESHERQLADNEDRQRLAEEARRRNISTWAVLGRVAARELRQPSNRKRSEIVREIADRYAVQSGLVDTLVRQHERDRREALRHRRDREILLLDLQGLGPTKIVERLGTRRRPVTRQTVHRVLKEHADVSAALERLFPHTMASVRRRKAPWHD